MTNQLSIIQSEYLYHVNHNDYFLVKGKSLICRGKTFPIAMANNLGVYPKNVDKKDLEKAI